MSHSNLSQKLKAAHHLQHTMRVGAPQFLATQPHFCPKNQIRATTVVLPQTFTIIFSFAPLSRNRVGAPLFNKPQIPERPKHPNKPSLASLH